MCKECNCQSGETSSCECGGECCGGQTRSIFERRYQTKAEQIAELEDYLSELKLEMQAVEEHLADLRR